MAHFDVYNSTDPNLWDAEAEEGLCPPLAEEEEVILGPIQTDGAEKIVGTVFSDAKGDIYIEQSFDWDFNKAEGNWDISAKYAYTAEGGEGFTEEIIAPVVRVRYVNGAAGQEEVRIFARTFAFSQN